MAIDVRFGCQTRVGPELEGDRVGVKLERKLLARSQKADASV